MKTAIKAKAFDRLVEDLATNCKLYSCTPALGHYTFDLNSVGFNYVRVEIMPNLNDLEAKVTARLVLVSRLKQYYDYQ